MQVYMCEHHLLKFIPKHILVMMQKSSLKKNFAEFCLKFDPLNRFESKEFE